MPKQTCVYSFLALPQLALLDSNRTPGAMTYIIAQPCIDTKDASCVEVCPVDCIYDAEDQFYIHPDECIDCGACEPECPVQAIFPDTDVPAEWTNYIAKNREHFE